MNAVADLSEIDLIPAAYRHERALLKALRRTGFAILAVLVAGGAATAALRHATETTRTEVERLSAMAAATEQQRAGVETLTLRKAAVEARLGLLSGLRQPAAVDELMAAVAYAVPAERMWFVSWRFERAVTDLAAGTTDASVLNTAPVQVQMTISGQARDHGAVSEFAEALLRNPSMREVNVPRIHRDYDSAVLLFDVVVAVELPGTPP